MAYYVITNGEGYAKAFHRREMSISKLELPSGTADLHSTHPGLMLPPTTILVIVNDDLLAYRALIGVDIGWPCPMDDPMYLGTDGDWFHYPMTFKDQQYGTNLDDLPGVREAILMASAIPH